MGENMTIPRKEIDLSTVPYAHKNGAANLLISKAQRLADFADLYFHDLSDKDIKKARQAISYYDLALKLMKPYDGNYQTIIHWKCLVLVALEQFEDAASWYEELIRLAVESEGPNHNNATAKEAQRQLQKIQGKKASPLALMAMKYETSSLVGRKRALRQGGRHYPYLS